jgi:hypothetical protein
MFFFVIGNNNRNNNWQSLKNWKFTSSYSAASSSTTTTWKSGDKVIIIYFTPLTPSSISNLPLFLYKYEKQKNNYENIFLLRTNTYPKIPERFRLRSTDGTLPNSPQQTGAQQQSPSTPNKTRSVSLHGQQQSPTTPLLTKVSPNNHLNSNNRDGRDNNKDGKEEEVIYF